jgi:hypothetical protein
MWRSASVKDLPGRNSIAARRILTIRLFDLWAYCRLYRKAPVTRYQIRIGASRATKKRRFLPSYMQLLIFEVFD